MEAALELGVFRVIDPVHGPEDAFREEDPEEGIVGALGGCCWRMRLRPEAPRPCSCSVMIGDLVEEFESAYVAV